MSWSKEVIIKCDGEECPEWNFFSANLSTAMIIVLLREDDWTTFYDNAERKDYVRGVLD